jgi:hypothetical protein
MRSSSRRLGSSGLGRAIASPIEDRMSAPSHWRRSDRRGSTSRAARRGLATGAAEPRLHMQIGDPARLLASPAIGEKRVPPGVCGRPLSRSTDRLRRHPVVPPVPMRGGWPPLVLSPRRRRPVRDPATRSERMSSGTTRRSGADCRIPRQCSRAARFRSGTDPMAQPRTAALSCFARRSRSDRLQPAIARRRGRGP